MAEELTTDQPEDGLPVFKRQSTTTEDGLPILKKKVDTIGGGNTLQPLNTGGQLDPVSLINTTNATAPLAPVTDKQLRTDIQVKDDAIRQQKLQQQERLSNNLKKIRNQLPEESQKFWDKAVKLTADRVSDRLTTPTKDEEEHQWIMDELDKTWQGKLVKAVGYLGSKASKGTLQIAKGVAHQAELSQNPLRFATGQDGATDNFFKKADGFANFGLTKGDLSNIEQGDSMGSHAMATGGTMAEMAPAIVLGSAASAPTALFWLQGIGMGKDLTDDLKKQGKDLNPLAKEALIQGSGVVNMILSRIGDMYGKLPAIARGKIASGLAAEALQNVAGKELTSDVFKTELVSLSKTFAQKLETAPLEILNKYNHTATTFAGLNTASYIMHKGVDAINDKPVFNESLGNLAENLYKSVTQEAPMFTIAGSLPEITKLTPYSGYKNDVVESIVRDPSKENVDVIKSQIANHGSEQGWSQEEMAGSLQHIEQIGAATRKLPNTITPDKKSDAVGLIIDRDGLTKKLKQIQDGKQELDPAIADVPTAQEQYLTDKIEQANDKIRSIVTGKKVTYSKDESNPEKPKFFKTIDGKQENIEQSRYDLENTERQLKTTTNEQPLQPENDKVNTELLPEQQKETSVNVPDEKTKPIVDEQPITNNEQSRPTANNTGTVEPIAEPIQQPEAKQTEAIPTEETVPKGDKGVQSPTEPIGITKEETRKQREIRGLENLPDAEKTTLSKMFDEGKEAVQSRQVEPRKLSISVADKPRNLSPVEVNSLLYDRQAIRAESDAIRGQIEDLLVKESKGSKFDNLLNSTSESMQVLQDRQRFLDAALDNNEKALRAGANQNALALVAMQNMINADYTLSEQRSRMRVKAGGELTKAMEAELERYDKELKEAKAQVEDYKQRLSDKLAKEEIKKAQAVARTGKKVESKDAILAERKAIVDDFKVAWEKARILGRKNLSSDIPYRRELAAATVYMTRMVGNLAKEGIVEFKDVIDKIYDEFKEHIDNLTKDDVRDVLAGTYKERKESKNDLLEQKNAILRIAKLTKQIEDLKNGVKEEKKESRLIKKRNAIVELENEVKTLKSQARIEDAANLEKESLKRRLENLNERIKNEDFEKPQGRPKVEADAESITLTAKLRKAQNNFDAMAQRLGSHTESGLDKTLSTIQQVRRFMLLSGVKTLGKLYAFAADRTVTTPIEEVVNTLNSKLPFLRKIAQRSPRFSGGIDPKAESTAIITRISKATLKDSWIDVLKTGVGELDRVYGKHGVDKDFDLNPSALEFFGRLHGAFKNSTKRAEFFRSYQKRLQHEAEQGKDINDPNVQFAIGLEAYADGKRAILMNDNILVDKGYKSLLRGLESGDNNQAGKVFAAVVRGLFPIVKIPANYVVESFDVATLGTRAIPKIIQAMVKGADTLSPKEADMVMRTIVKGQIGLALMMYAYANPKMFGGYYSGKRKDDDLKAGDIIIGGYHLPHWMAHNPYFEAMQMAATMRRAIDTANGNGAPEGIMNQLTTSKRDDLVSMAVAKSDKYNPDSQLVEVQDGKQLYQVYLKGNNATSIVKEGGIKQGINTAAKGLLEQIPFTSIGDMMSSTSSPATFAGSVVKNLTEPRFVQEISEWTDRKNGEMVKRDPQGFVEQLKSGIPGLRQYVTEKEVKKDKKVSTIRIPASDGEPETVLQLPADIIAEREKLNQQFLKDKESIIRAYFKAYKLTEHDIQRRLKDVSNDYSAPIIYQKYKDRLKQIEE